MRESTIEKHLVNQVAKSGGWAIKLYALSVAGMPDRLVIKDGKVWFVELKAPGKKPRKIQKFIHDKLEKLGFKVLVIDSKEQVNEFVESF